MAGPIPTNDYMGVIDDGGPTHIPLTIIDDVQAGGKARPDFGPGYETPTGGSRAQPHRITVGTNPTHGTWTPDEFTGVHAFIPYHDISAHAGNQEGWRVELANDLPVVSSELVPWDHGLFAPVQTDPNFRI